MSLSEKDEKVGGLVSFFKFFDKFGEFEDSDGEGKWTYTVYSNA